MKFHFVTILTISVSVTADLTSPECPAPLEDSSSQSLSNTQQTLYADKFEAFVASVANLGWVKAFASALLPATVNVHQILQSLEGDEDYGSTSLIPLPDGSLYAVYEFIAKRKIHCLAQKSAIDLIMALVRIDAATGTGGMSDFSESDYGFLDSEIQTQANSGAGSLNSPGDESLDPRTFFQYTNVDVLKIFGALVDSYNFQLKQLEVASAAIYSSHEKGLLKAQTDFWGQQAATSLLKLWRLFEAGEPYLRESDPWNGNDFDNWLALIQVQTGVDYGGTSNNEPEPIGLSGLDESDIF
ncbi:hypothetical protein TWF730_011172 [Orbilia blumenaviensis]|uniref:Uncharacterized protein n=1 Tax=Orbilia blumenaviensis TaxID=1796055 RepID=A0AAV9UN07_9PEZI